MWKHQVNLDIKSPISWGRYCRLIDRAFARPKPTGYSEKHHAWPKSHGGSNARSNLVTLTAREHFLAHWLLWKAIGTKEMAIAFQNMCVVENEFHRRHKCTARAFESARVAATFAMTGSNNHAFGSLGMFQGKNHSEGTKAKMKEIALSQEVVDLKQLAYYRNKKEAWARAEKVQDLLGSNPKMGGKAIFRSIHGFVCPDDSWDMYESIKTKLNKGWNPREDQVWIEFMLGVPDVSSLPHPVCKPRARRQA